MTRIERDIRRLAASVGLRCVRLLPGGKHHRLVGETRAGHVVVMPVSLCAANYGDRRLLRNMRRRFCHLIAEARERGLGDRRSIA